MTILDELALTARERVKRDKEKIGVKEMCSLALKDDLITGSAFYEAIKKGMKWESQVDLLLKYGATLDESCLEAAKLSGDEDMIKKIEKLIFHSYAR